MSLARYWSRPEILPAVKIVGLHLHIGSQITELAPFETAYARGIEIFRTIQSSGHELRTLDLGGGFGVRDRGKPALDADRFAALVARLTDGLGARLIFEPGRALVAEAGVLLSRVIYRKTTPERSFLIVDAGMHTLIRPALYDAYHEIVGRARDGSPPLGDGCGRADLREQ